MERTWSVMTLRDTSVSYTHLDVYKRQVMSLAAKKGEELTVVCEGDQEEAAAAAMEAFLKENL